MTERRNYSSAGSANATQGQLETGTRHSGQVVSVPGAAPAVAPLRRDTPWPWSGNLVSFRTVQTHFWTDPDVRKLPPDSKLLLLYLITNPHTHVSGIYYLPIS